MPRKIRYPDTITVMISLVKLGELLASLRILLLLCHNPFSLLCLRIEAIIQYTMK